jgi:hypothetical protein
MRTIEFQEGKSYHLNTPRGGSYTPKGRMDTKVHIDKIMGNPTDERSECRLIVYRYWRRRRQRWEWECDELWVLQMYNENYDLKLIEN